MTELQGRRVPIGTVPNDYEPGDYGRAGKGVADPTDLYWWVCLPTGVLGRLDDRWSVTEHDDGAVSAGDPLGSSPADERERAAAIGHTRGCSITVTPSVFDSPAGWHGWLDHGVWRSIPDYQPLSALGSERQEGKPDA
jgi:hypothetical protein